MTRNNHKVKYKDEEVVVMVPIGDGSKFDFIEDRYQNIKYLEREVGDGVYHCIIFNLKNNMQCMPICESFLEILDKKPQDVKYETSIKDIITFFERISSVSKAEKIIGDIGEALFILKLLELDLIREINDSLLHREDNDAYDFTFSNGNIIEVKTTSKFKSEINVNNRQNMNVEKYNILICKIDTTQTKNNDKWKNILDIYEDIKKKTNFNSFLLNKESKYKSDRELVEKFYINIETASFCMLDKEFLPQVQIIKEGALKKLIFVLDATSSIIKETPKHLEGRLINLLRNSRGLFHN